METAIKIEAQPVVEDLHANYFGIEWIDTEKLVVDPKYQRRVKHALVKSIKNEWDWRAVRTLAVSFRNDGTYAVIDGQQRLTAARENDIKRLPCQVYIDLTEQQEAELFLKLNNSNKPNTNDMFRAMIAEGDQEAKIILMAIRSTGWELDLDVENRGSAHGKTYSATAVSTAATLLRIYRGHGVLHLQSVLNICHGWYGQHMAVSSDMMLAISRLLAQHKNELDMSRLTEKLSQETPSGLIGKAVQFIAGERAMNISLTNSRYSAITKAIIASYNKGLRPANRIGDKA